MVATTIPTAPKPKIVSSLQTIKVEHVNSVLLDFRTIWIYSQAEYIFPRPRKVSPRDGTEVKTCFICRGKVSFSAVVEKKDSCLTMRSSCLTDRSSCLPKQSEGRQRREVRQRSEVRQSF